MPIADLSTFDHLYVDDDVDVDVDDTQTWSGPVLFAGR